MYSRVCIINFVINFALTHFALTHYTKHTTQKSLRFMYISRSSIYNPFIKIIN